MKEIIAKIIIKELNTIIKEQDSTDYNDIFNYVELIMANEEEIAAQLEKNWHVSNKFNSKTVYRREIGFSDVDEDGNQIFFVHTYVLDGNSRKRICTKASQKDFINVEYNHRDLETILKLSNELIEKAREILPKQDEYVATKYVKSDLEDYSEKCYKTSEGFIPKSVVAFDDEQVVVIKWFFDKNKFWLV